MQCFTDKRCTRVRLPLRFGGEEMGPPCPVGVLLATSFCGLGGFLGAAFRAMSRCSRAPLSLSSSPSPPPGQPSPSSTRRPPFARSHLAWCSIGVGSRSRAAQIGTAGIAGVRGFRAVWWPHARPCLRRSLPPLPLAARLMPGCCRCCPRPGLGYLNNPYICYICTPLRSRPTWESTRHLRTKSDRHKTWTSYEL